MCILCETPFSMEISKRPAALPNPRAEWPLLHLSFILIGVITTFLGPILPFFSRHWALTDAQSGFFFATQYFGSFLGVILTGWMLPRYGFSKVNAMGFAAFLLGFSVLGIGPWWLAAALVAVSGFGYGLTNPAINLRATQLPSANTAAAVTFLNFSWSIGSVLCPYLVGLLVPRIGIWGMTVSIAAAALVLGVLFFAAILEGGFRQLVASTSLRFAIGAATDRAGRGLSASARTAPSAPVRTRCFATPAKGLRGQWLRADHPPSGRRLGGSGWRARASGTLFVSALSHST